MTQQPGRNMADSVRQRLLNIRSASGDDPALYRGAAVTERAGSGIRPSIVDIPESDHLRSIGCCRGRRPWVWSRVNAALTASPESTLRRGKSLSELLCDDSVSLSHRIWVDGHRGCSRSHIEAVAPRNGLGRHLVRHILHNIANATSGAERYRFAHIELGVVPVHFRQG